MTRPDLGCGLKQEAAEGFQGYSRSLKCLGFGNMANRVGIVPQHSAFGLYGCVAASEVLNISTLRNVISRWGLGCDSLDA